MSFTLYGNVYRTQAMTFWRIQILGKFSISFILIAINAHIIYCVESSWEIPVNNYQFGNSQYFYSDDIRQNVEFIPQYIALSLTLTLTLPL